MTLSARRLLGLGTAIAVTTLVVACSPTTSRTSSSTFAQPAPSAPVQTASVQATDLPAIGGQQSTTVTGGQPSTGGMFDPLASTPSSEGFVSLDPVGASTVGGRDLSGALTMEKLLGGWTVMAGADQCRLNLTYTAKGATGRYRASTPACNQPTLAAVTSWQLLGSQIQLYNEADEIVGTLLRSGDRFVGTLAGGQAISMVG